jgi:hypothetical protein
MNVSSPIDFNSGSGFKIKSGSKNFSLMNSNKHGGAGGGVNQTQSNALSHFLGNHAHLKGHHHYHNHH